MSNVWIIPYFSTRLSSSWGSITRADQDSGGGSRRRYRMFIGPVHTLHELRDVRFMDESAARRLDREGGLSVEINGVQPFTVRAERLPQGCPGKALRFGPEGGVAWEQVGPELIELRPGERLILPVDGEALQELDGLVRALGGFAADVQLSLWGALGRPSLDLRVTLLELERGQGLYETALGAPAPEAVATTRQTAGAAKVDQRDDRTGEALARLRGFFAERGPVAFVLLMVVALLLTLLVALLGYRYLHATKGAEAPDAAAAGPQVQATTAIPESSPPPADADTRTRLQQAAESAAKSKSLGNLQEILSNAPHSWVSSEDGFPLLQLTCEPGGGRMNAGRWTECAKKLDEGVRFGLAWAFCTLSEKPEPYPGLADRKTLLDAKIPTCVEALGHEKEVDQLIQKLQTDTTQSVESTPSTKVPD